MRFLKIGGVIIGAIVLTALGIDAADTLQGSRGTLLGQLIQTTPAQEGGCPAGMVSVPTAQSFTCVDRYEASVSDECPHQSPSNANQSAENLAQANCSAHSRQNVSPWTFITREQAQTACMKAGKRLPSSAELYFIAVGTPDIRSACNIDSSGAKGTGSLSECKSALGAYDAIGNVWEWSTDDVIDGMYKERQLPESGYVQQVDSGGMAVMTADQPSELFYGDYFWSETSGAYGVMRGGFYGSEEDAGVYAVHARIEPTTAGAAVGFRCVL